MTYFTGCVTEKDVRQRYKELAKQLHPDLNPEKGDEEFKDMCNQYEKALGDFDVNTDDENIGEVYLNSAVDIYKYFLNTLKDKEQAFVETLTECLKKGIIIKLNDFRFFRKELKKDEIWMLKTFLKYKDKRYN